MSEQVSKFREALEKDVFAVTWELVPGRGSFERAQEDAIAAAQAAAKGGKVHTVSITDNPGGNPAISAEMLGAELSNAGVEPLVHFTCKDKGRNQLEALLYGLERAAVRDLLILTGDYTLTGYQGRSNPVFDMDASQLLELVTALNQGMEIPLLRRTITLAPTHFFAGAVVSPFKALEAEAMGQYYKLKRKLVAGAQFIVTQVGFDARKFHEALLMMKLLGFGHIPVIGNVYVLAAGPARAMHENRVAGCVVTDKLLAEITEEANAKDKGKSKRLERAAKMYALLKGMGYRGVHIGGSGLQYRDVENIIGMGEQLAPRWQELIAEFDYPQPNGWYYFEKDAATGLNSEVMTDRSKRPQTPLAYRFFRVLHKSLFEIKSPLFKPMRAISERIDGSRFEDTFTRLEHVGKVISNDCMHCGDCGLPDTAYVCPTSQCPKGQRNGPCGGSYEGWCEVYPNRRQCIYVRAYARLKHYGDEETLGAYQVPPVNYDLRRTSSWLNYYLGRDHTSKRLGIQPPAKKEKAVGEVE
jgi:methylenetetrahydrofolate reductase (NADPH)